MNLSGIFARLVALIGAAALLWRRLQGAAPEPAWGSAPQVPAAKPQGALPTLKMPTARGWRDGEKPVAAPGLKVNAFATGLKHPRWINVLPNGDVLVAESNQVAGPTRTLFGYAMQATMRRAAALGESANRITLLRDADGDGIAERRDVFMRGTEPAVRHGAGGRHFLCRQHRRRGGLPLCGGRRPHHGARAQTDQLQAERTLDAEPAAEPRRQASSLSGSARSAISPSTAWRSEEGRAAIYELDLADGSSRIFASGLRNPVGLAWEPSTGALWTVVNERDGIGDETPPDYLTSVRDRRVLRLALLLLGADGGRSGAAGSGRGRQSHHAGLRAGRPYRVARPVLAAGRHASRLSRRHGHRAARLLEPQHAERLQGGVRAVRERPPGRAAAGYPDRIPRPRTSVCPTDDRSGSPSVPMAPSWWRTTSAM